MSRSDAAVPVVVLAGFLGAGKTTVLNHLLASGDGRRIGVLVNDFGEINIDALLISGRTGGTLTLSNGCICCSVGDGEFDEALESLLTSGAELDLIVVEASGIAEPKALVRMVVGARENRAAYGGLVYLLDAPNFAETLARHPECADHIAVADLVVINKIDLLDDRAAERIAEITARVCELNPTAPVVATRNGAVDPAMLTDPAAQSDGAEDRGPRQLALDDLLAEAAGRESHLHAEYQSVSVTGPGPADPRRVAALLERPPAGCYRIKGVLWFDPPGRRWSYSVSAVGGFVHADRRSGRGRPADCSLVAIGAGIDEAATRQALEAVLVPAPADDENGLLRIDRYLPQS